MHTRAALYIRVSTERQEDLSPDAQKRLLLEYADKNSLLVEDEHIYIDSGISGRRAGRRPQFQNMIAVAKSQPRPFDTILVWKFSRFARNQEESIVYKSMLRQKCGIDVISISEPVVEGPFGGLIERIIEWMDEYYSIRLSGEVMRGMVENAMRCAVQGKLPYGYRKENGKIVPVPEEADVVRTMFDLYTNQRKSPFTISRLLLSENISTRTGKPFQSHSIKYILKNEFYTGTYLWNRKNTELKESDEADGTEGMNGTDSGSGSELIRIENAFPAIISRDLYERTQLRFEANKIYEGERPPETYAHWLSGLLRCSGCGCKLTMRGGQATKNGKKYHSFQCDKYNRGICLESHSISVPKLEKSVFESFEKVMDSGSIEFEKIVTADSGIRVTNLEKRLSNLQVRERRAKEAYLAGIDTLEEYRQAKNALEQERADIERSLNQFRTSITRADRIQMLKNVETVYAYLKDDTVSIPDKSEAIKSIVSKIVYDKQKKELRIFYYLPA